MKGFYKFSEGLLQVENHDKDPNPTKLDGLFVLFSIL